MPLTKCPKCGHRRYDPWADACERRACGYVKPDPPDEQAESVRGD